MSGTAPLVSVILPAYNAAAWLSAAVESALSQSYRPLEVLVVDDGSTDATPDVMARLGGRVRGFRQPNQGVSAARNTAMQAARGELFAFLDADDEWLAGKLDCQVDLLQSRPDLSLVYGQVVAVGAEGRERGILPRAGGEDDYPHLYHSNRIPTSTVLVRRQAQREAGEFDPVLRITQDYDLWLRVAASGRFAGLRKPLARYRVHGKGLSSDARRRYAEHLTILERAPLRPDLGVDGIARERARAHYEYRLGRLAARQRHWREAAAFFSRVLRRPSRYGARRRGPADHRVRYWRALRWYLVSRARASLGGSR